MKNLPLAAVLGVLVCLAGARTVRADDALKRIQQSLHDQGFYYGAIDGTPGDETTHAISRYQIRNGLAVTGQLNDETTQSINRSGAAVAKSSPGGKITGDNPRSGNSASASEDRRYAQGDDAPATSRATPPPLYHPPPPSNRPDPGDEDDDNAPVARAPSNRPDLRASPDDANPAAPPRGGGIPPSAALTSVFERTPYEFAPPPVQADVLRRAQSILLRDGFYDGEANGRPNPVTFEALTNFQGVNHLHRTGRLDTATLAQMRLLPDRRAGPARGGPYDDGRRGPGSVYEGRVTQ